MILFHKQEMYPILYIQVGHRILHFHQNQLQFYYMQLEYLELRYNFDRMIP